MDSYPFRAPITGPHTTLSPVQAVLLSGAWLAAPFMLPLKVSILHCYSCRGCCCSDCFAVRNIASCPFHASLRGQHTTLSPLQAVLLQQLLCCQAASLSLAPSPACLAALVARCQLLPLKTAQSSARDTINNAQVELDNRTEHNEIGEHNINAPQGAHASGSPSKTYTIILLIVLPTWQLQ